LCDSRSNLHIPREQFVLRLATRDDIPALHLLIEQSIRGLQAKDYTPAQMEGAIGHALGLDTQLIEDQTYFVATPANEPQRLAGCGGWSFRRTLFGSDGGPGRAAELLDPHTDAAKIRAIFVHPDFTRRGLGTLLLHHCERAAHDAGFRTLEMGSTLTGVPVYARNGYRETGRRDVPLPNGCVLPIVFMIKEANAS
jgi:GNAT superfamily N-acetyltransferase